MGVLQVRQGRISPLGPTDWGGWLDVVSPAWLIGFILPNSGMVYQFRNAQEIDQSDA